MHHSGKFQACLQTLVRLEWPARDKQTSLIQTFLNNGHKKSQNIGLSVQLVSYSFYKDATTFTIMTLSKKRLLATLSIKDSQYNSPSTIMLNVVMMNVVMLNVVMLCVIMLNVVMLSVVEPFQGWFYPKLT